MAFAWESRGTLFRRFGVPMKRAGRKERERRVISRSWSSGGVVEKEVKETVF